MSYGFSQESIDEKQEALRRVQNPDFIVWHKNWPLLDLFCSCTDYKYGGEKRDKLLGIARVDLLATIQLSGYTKPKTIAKLFQGIRWIEFGLQNPDFEWLADYTPQE